MSVLKYFKNIPRSPPHRATCPKCNFFSSNSQRGPWQKKGACRPPNGQQGLVAHPRGDRPLSPVGGGDRPLFFVRDLVANLKKKITLRACRPMGGDRGIFLKYFKTDIYF